MGPKFTNNLYYNKIIIITYIMTSKITLVTIINKYIGYNSFSINFSNTAFLNLSSLTIGYTRVT